MPPRGLPEIRPLHVIVDENITIFRCDLGHGKGLDAYPTDDELRTKWAKVD